MNALIEQYPAFSITSLSILLLFALLASAWLLRSKAGARLGASFVLFTLALSGFAWIQLRQHYLFADGQGSDWDNPLLYKWYLAALVFFGVWYLARILASLLWDFYIPRYKKTQVPGLLRSLLITLILITAILLIAKFIFALQLSGLLVASSVMAAVIAFALQDFLSGLIAGIALNIQPPFEVGDWIQIGATEGEVIDVNWRATTIRTLQRTYLVVPNSSIARENIINFTKPTRLHALLLTIGVDYDSPPSLVKQTLNNCVLDAEGARSTPPPVCRLIEFGDFAITYEIKFYIDNHAKHNDIRDQVMTRAWYSLRREGIKIPFPIREVYLHDSGERRQEHQQKADNRQQLLRQAAIFDPLNDTDIDDLIAAGNCLFFGRGERIVIQGDDGQSLYLVLTGTAQAYARLPEDNREIELGSLASGDYFGEKSLLTGEPRSASVIASSDIEVIEINKSALSPVLKNNPELAEGLCQRLAERQLLNEGFFAEARKDQDVSQARQQYSAKFLSRIKSFFGV